MRVEEDLGCIARLSLPDASGLEGLQAVRARAPHVPIVVLSGEENEEVAVQAVHEGAQDYLVKRHADGHLLGRAIRYAVERKHAELELAHRATHDALTDLPNRTLFLDRLRITLARVERAAPVLFLFPPDRSRVQRHHGSDSRRLLVEAAERLQTLVRRATPSLGFGGDEFMVLPTTSHPSDPSGGGSIEALGPAVYIAA